MLPAHGPNRQCCAVAFPHRSNQCRSWSRRRRASSINTHRGRAPRPSAPYTPARRPCIQSTHVAGIFAQSIFCPAGGGGIVSAGEGGISKIRRIARGLLRPTEKRQGIWIRTGGQSAHYGQWHQHVFQTAHPNTPRVPSRGARRRATTILQEQKRHDLSRSRSYPSQPRHPMQALDQPENSHHSGELRVTLALKHGVSIPSAARSERATYNCRMPREANVRRRVRRWSTITRKSS